MIITLLKTFILPPAFQLLVLAVGLILWRRAKKTAYLLIGLAWVSLLLLSLPVVSFGLFNWLESPYIAQLSDESVVDAEAIVVLGGGRQLNLPEYGGDQVSYQALWRLRYGARVARQLQLPVIVSGGKVYPYEELSEAAMAAKLLIEEYGIADVWQEGESRDTWQNAQKTADFARQKNIQNVILVTHAYHMRRAESAFRHFGLNVIPMATGFYSVRGSGWINDWLPQAAALNASRRALHEYIGLVFYRLRQ